MAVLVRSWNVFHGNSVPVGRRTRLADMLRLAAADEPDVLCLQELPVWSFERLGEWSGMTPLSDTARHPHFGPVPAPPRAAKAVTLVDNGRFRSAFAGQGNAVLLGPGTRVLDRKKLVLNDRAFRHAQARQLTLPPLARLAWAKERRVAQVLRLALADGRTAVLANLHASAYRPDDRLADAEVLRAAVYATAEADTNELTVLVGDFNVTQARSATLEELRDWGFSGGGPGIDHVVVRGGEPEPLRVWPARRRTVAGTLLSDHAPVELTIR